MNRFYLIIIMVFVGVSAFCSQHANVVWNTPSRNSSESMPCGGGDIGMNIWVEEGDLLFYVSRSGTFDENNCQLKLKSDKVKLEFIAPEQPCCAYIEKNRLSQLIINFVTNAIKFTTEGSIRFGFYILVYITL